MKIDLIVIIINILSYLIISWLVYILWNLLLPNLFNTPYITYLQSIGLYTLCNLLFKSSNTNLKITEENE